ncbi:MAG: hypothetical protein SV966_02755 [Actinomycetota bacterium]|nr:hypothetical protein [Actinomycetota bacterium]
MSLIREVADGPGAADPPTGVLEVGYDIRCGIDMSMSKTACR